MKFYEWLKTINESADWEKYITIEDLEEFLVANIKAGGYINLKEIIGQFCSNDDSGACDGLFPITKSNEIKEFMCLNDRLHKDKA